MAHLDLNLSTHDPIARRTDLDILKSFCTVARVPYMSDLDGSEMVHNARVYIGSVKACATARMRRARGGSEGWRSCRRVRGGSHGEREKSKDSKRRVRVKQ